MNSALCIVEIASYHGPQQQIRWRRCFRGQSRADCYRYIDSVVAEVVADDPLTSLLAQQHAREQFRIYRLRGVK